MATERVSRGGRPRTLGNPDDPLVTVSLHVRKNQLAELDQLADAEHISRAALVREAIDRLLRNYLDHRGVVPGAASTSGHRRVAATPSNGSLSSPSGPGGHDLLTAMPACVRRPLAAQEKFSAQAERAFPRHDDD
jgi:hypothetical protein